MEMKGACTNNPKIYLVYKNDFSWLDYKDFCQTGCKDSCDLAYRGKLELEYMGSLKITYRESPYLPIFSRTL